MYGKEHIKEKEVREGGKKKKRCGEGRKATRKEGKA